MILQQRSKNRKHLSYGLDVCNSVIFKRKSGLYGDITEKDFLKLPNVQRDLDLLERSKEVKSKEAYYSDYFSDRQKVMQRVNHSKAKFNRAN